MSTMAIPVQIVSLLLEVSRNLHNTICTICTWWVKDEWTYQKGVCKNGCVLIVRCWLTDGVPFGEENMALGTANLEFSNISISHYKLLYLGTA